jgi:Zn-finger domain-containing protein
MTRRNEYFIREDILRCYSMLSPENLSCDGQLNKTQIRAKQSKLYKELKHLFKEYGKIISEDEAISWLNKKTVQLQKESIK